MGKIKIITFFVVLSLLTYFSGSVAGQVEDVLRIHIIANTNSPKDQFVKYQVRDAVLLEYSDELKALRGKGEIESFIQSNLDGIVNIASRVLKEQGLEYGATAELGEFDFPTRMYLDTIYPGGKYKAVKVVLGEGQGDNWWCVMFPPLCLVGEAKENSSTTTSGVEDLENSGTNVEASAVEYEFFLVSVVKNIFGFIKGIFS